MPQVAYTFTGDQGVNVQIDATIPAGAATDPTSNPVRTGRRGGRLRRRRRGQPLGEPDHVAPRPPAKYTIVVGVFGERYGPYTLTVSAQ